MTFFGQVLANQMYFMFLLVWPEVLKWSVFELQYDRLRHIESSNGIDVC